MLYFIYFFSHLNSCKSGHVLCFIYLFLQSFNFVQISSCPALYFIYFFSHLISRKSGHVLYFIFLISSVIWILANQSMSCALFSLFLQSFKFMQIRPCPVFYFLAIDILISFKTDEFITFYINLA